MSDNSKEIVSRSLRIATYATIAALLAIAAAGYSSYKLVTRPATPVGVSDNGKVVPFVPLTKAYVTDARVIGFSEECVRRAFAHDFLNYRMTIASASECFTSQGAEMFATTMDGMLKELVAKRMIMSSSVEVPVITRGPLIKNGRVMWNVQTKMQLFREGQRERITPQSYVVDMDVYRVDLEENVRGISVGAFVVRPASM